MSKAWRVLLVSCVLALAVLAVGWWILPQAVQALPGSVRVRLPEVVLAWASTPLPTALPAPSIVARATAPILIPTLEPSPTATSQLPSNPTSETRTVTPHATVTPRPIATPSPSVTPTSTPKPLPRSARIQGLKVVPQQFNNCGPANLSIALNFYGIEVDQLDIAAVVRPGADDRNVSPYELVSYVQEHSELEAAAFSGGNLEVLKRLIAAGFPIIVEKGLRPSEWQGWMGHYLTLGGYDDDRQEFLSMDTLLGPWDSSGRLESYETVAEQWAHFNHTFVIAYPASESTIIAEILGPRFLDSTSMWQQAAVTAQALTEAEPSNAFNWFNLGTNLTRLGQLLDQDELFAGAAAAYDRAREIGLPWRMLWYQFEPYEAYLAAGRIDDVLTLAKAMLSSEGGRDVEEAYLYQGHAFLALGDTDRAAAAYRMALSLNPNFAAAQESLSGLPQQDG